MTSILMLEIDKPIVAFSKTPLFADSLFQIMI